MHLHVLTSLQCYPVSTTLIDEKNSECSNSVSLEVSEVGELEIRGDKMYKVKFWGGHDQAHRWQLDNAKEASWFQQLYEEYECLLSLPLMPQV